VLGPGEVTLPVSMNHLEGRDFHCSIEYDSLSLTRYETAVVIKNLVLTPPFHFGKTRPKVRKAKQWSSRGN